MKKIITSALALVLALALILTTLPMVVAEDDTFTVCTLEKGDIADVLSEYLGYKPEILELYKTQVQFYVRGGFKESLSFNLGSDGKVLLPNKKLNELRKLYSYPITTFNGDKEFISLSVAKKFVSDFTDGKAIIFQYVPSVIELEMTIAEGEGVNRVRLEWIKDFIYPNSSEKEPYIETEKLTQFVYQCELSKK